MADTANFAYAPAQVRDLDRAAIQERNIPGYVLMTRAGQATFAATRERFPAATRWLVLCGAGNNAGDGFVIARLARAAGLSVTVAALAEPRRLAGDAATAWRDFSTAGGQVVPFTADLLDAADLVVDAMLGTGLARALEGVWLHAVEQLNERGLPVVAVDIPSGLDGATGAVLGAAVRAALTVTYVGRKLGLYLGAGPDHTGRILFDELGIPADLKAAATPGLRLFAAEDLARLLPPRPRTAHKGSFGHVLVVGGNRGMAGAARLAAEAALRAGAGLVSVATRPGNELFVNAARPEIMAHGVADRADLEPLLARATVVALGPGLGQDAWAREMVSALADDGRPRVIDADALNLLAAAPSHSDNWILTPHPGEAARLLGRSTAAVQANRLEAVRELASRYGGVAVLKGRCTLVAVDGDIPWVIDRGNPGMATAGMGDVLTGVTAGLLAQVPGQPGAVAAAAAYAHASAADRAAGAGERGLVASDLFGELRSCLNPPS